MKCTKCRFEELKAKAERNGKRIMMVHQTASGHLRDTEEVEGKRLFLIPEEMGDTCFLQLSFESKQSLFYTEWLPSIPEECQCPEFEREDNV